MNALRWSVTGLTLFLVHCESWDTPRVGDGGSDHRQPHMHLANDRFDFGDADLYADLRHAFSITNEGNGALEIAGIVPTPDCTATASPSRIAPGQGGSLDITCRVGVVGPFHQVLRVRSNDPDAQNASVELVANARAALALDPSIALLHVPYGQSITKDVRLVGPLAASANPVVSAPSDDSIKVQLVPSASASAIRLSAQGTHLGMFSGAIVVSTGLPAPSAITLPYSVQVDSTLTIFPQTVYLDPSTPAGRSQVVNVTSSQPGFSVKSVAIKDGPFRAAIVRGEAASGVRVRVSFDDQNPAKITPQTAGTLLITSNDGAEPEKEIPIAIALHPAIASSASK